MIAACLTKDVPELYSTRKLITQQKYKLSNRLIYNNSSCHNTVYHKFTCFWDTVYH